MPPTVMKFPTPNPFAESLGAIGGAGMDIAQAMLFREAIERERRQTSLQERSQQLQLDLFTEKIATAERTAKARQKLAKMFQDQGGAAQGTPQTMPKNPFASTSEDKEAMRLLEVLPDLLEAYPEAAGQVLSKFLTPDKEAQIKGIPSGMFSKMPTADQRRLLGIESPAEQIEGALGVFGGQSMGPGMAEGPVGGPVMGGGRPGMMGEPNIPAGVEIKAGPITLKGEQVAEGRRKRVEWVGQQGYKMDDPGVRRYLATGDFTALPAGPSPKAQADVDAGNALKSMRQTMKEYQEFQLQVAKGERAPSVNDIRMMLGTLTKSREAIEIGDLDPETRTMALQNIDLAIAETARLLAQSTAGGPKVEGRRQLLDQAKKAVKSYGSREAALKAAERQPAEHRETFRKAVDLVFPK